MSNNFPLWIGILILVMASASGLMFAAGYYWHKLRHSDLSTASKPFDSDYVEQQIATFDRSLEGIEASLDSLSTAMRHINKRDKEKETDPILREQAYRIAQRMAAAGASRLELVKTCGITPGEATLIRRLHQEKGV